MSGFDSSCWRAQCHRFRTSTSRYQPKLLVPPLQKASSSLKSKCMPSHLQILITSLHLFLRETEVWLDRETKIVFQSRLLSWWRWARTIRVQLQKAVDCRWMTRHEVELLHLDLQILSEKVPGPSCDRPWWTNSGRRFASEYKVMFPPSFLLPFDTFISNPDSNYVFFKSHSNCSNSQTQTTCSPWSLCWDVGSSHLTSLLLLSTQELPTSQQGCKRSNDQWITSTSFIPFRR